eukprot:GFUD01097824.1.p1 GENE.GFUD01097824.1~~GFUD01097824.1.p1  ORF type:complete len:215 (-),score=58.69 GFUD01097824.1:73-717(-)
MFTSLLATALYILATTVSAFDTTENNLSIEDWKILKKEYFLQQFMEQLEKEPKKVIARSKEADLPKTIQAIDMKTDVKRATQYSAVKNPCPSDSSHDPENPCCTDSVEIDFHTLGWTFVLSPRKIQYKFCRGSCNPEFVRPALFTEAAAQILYKLHHTSGMKLDSPCCSPHNHQSIEVIFINKTNSIIGGFIPEFYDVSLVTVKDVIVTNCRCG